MNVIKDMLHLNKEVEPVQSGPAPLATVSAPLKPVEPITADKLALAKQTLAPTTATTEAPLATSSTSSTLILEEPIAQLTEEKLVIAEPVNLETIEKDVVVHEHIHPIQKEEIQPVIFREREQLEIKQVTENLHETQVEPTLVEQRELAPLVKETVVEESAAIPENIAIPSVDRDVTLKSVQVNAPLVNETIKKTIVTEVQPVLEKDLVVPVLIQETQPVYEKIIEAPVVIKEVTAVREIGSGQAFNMEKVNPFTQDAFVGKSTTQIPPNVL
jgi:hypothetical protein